MAGMLGVFQNLELRAVTFTRSRGWGADQSIVEAIVPANFDIVEPAGDTVARPINKPDPASITIDSAPPQAGREPTEDPTAARLEPFGYLMLGESIDGLEAQASQVQAGPWRFVVGPLFVAGVEEVKKATESGPRIVSIRLVDERYFWPRGLVGKWSFNRKLASGGWALDSHKPGSTQENPIPYSKREIAALCVAGLPRKPELAAAPSSWELEKIPTELPLWGRAVDCLAQLARGSGLEEPCLRLDGKVGLHVPGDGLLGYAEDGKGPNEKPIPPELVLWKEGAGQGKQAEPSWPEPWALVVGGERIATVAVDDCEPVLIFPPDNRVRPLDEDTIRKLTGGAYGIGWLQGFVLRPSAYQSNINVDPDTAALLADQAWKLWRLRGAVVRGEDEGGLQGFGPGPNAHLLPLRDRAETDESGRRLPAQVETFTFKPVHHALKGNPTVVRLNEVRKLASEVRETITPEVVLGRKNRVGTPSVLGSEDVGSLFALDPKKDAVVDVSLEEFQDALNSAREGDQWRGTPNGDAIASSLKELKLEEAKLEEEAGGLAGRDEMLLLAYEVLEAEEALEETARASGPIDSADPFRLEKALADPANKAIKDDLRRKLQSLVRKIGAERAERQEENREAETGLKPPERDENGRITKIYVASEEVGLVRYTNQLRKVDAGATVISEATGVIRTSDLAGIVVPDGVGDLSRAVFKPAPVRFVFGATMKPRVDIPPPRPEGTPTPDPRADEDPEKDSTNDLGDRPIVGGQNVIPSVLSDQESHYVTAWERVDRGQAAPRPLADCPLDQAVRLADRDLVELVQLNGSTNRGKLDDQAKAMAREAFSAPDVVKAERMIVGHLWPVQCDGVVRAVEIRTRFEGGVPCGYETLIATGGSSAPVPATVGDTTDKRRGGADREGLLS